jgi:hypothetical protein
MDVESRVWGVGLTCSVHRSPRSRGQIRVRADRSSEDACSAVGGTGTVSLEISRHHDANEGDSFYEGHTMDLVTFATRVCKLLGVETMIGTLNCIIWMVCKY